jgi:DNA helicase-2/ATP-dependent DNA helicase PcrA
MELTLEQKEAVTHPCENLQLIACAGSGKTEVVARRVVHMLKADGGGLKASNIIAFTFTEKAAGELKERITARCKDEFSELTGLADMFVGTIHAYCLELIKTEVPKYLKFEVLNDVQQYLFIDRHSKQSGLTTSEDLKGRQLQRYTDTRIYLTALSILRESNIDKRALGNSSILNGLEAYRLLLDRRSYLDYSAILEAAKYVLTNDEDLRARIADRVRYVVVDEYQDVNPIQETIVKLLHDLGAKVCVVGDDDQTIYQWRGSDVQDILTFADRYPNVERIVLDKNFRSSQGIVETARQFIEQNPHRLPKEMKASAEHTYESGDICALWFSSQHEEAQYVAETASALRGVAFREENGERGLSWSDMAVLLRSVKNNGEPIMRAFETAEIPYVVIGMTDLFRSAEAEAARQLFYFMADREGVHELDLERSWVEANLGLNVSELRAAIANVAQAKDMLSEADQKRWGVYTIQRVFLKFLEDAGMCEDRVPGRRGETVFYNLGKFSQLISDFETIYFHSRPSSKYVSFADFLKYRAEDAYPEGWQDSQYANPDAVRIMTVHQAKGMQWPVVFLPAMLRNRFPSGAIGGRGVWHILPREAVRGQERFEGSKEDERRLFYVAMTRSQKFLHVTWAPLKASRYKKPSEFWENILVSKWVKRLQPDYSSRTRLEPVPRKGVANVVFSFSDLKYYFECPYEFKLRILYGFNAPIHEALGYGKSLHDALAEIHARAIRGDIAGLDEVPRLIETHLHTPYAYPALRQQLEKAAIHVLEDYINDNVALLRKIEFSEKRIEIALADGVTVNGRIDLVRRLDTDETTIVDLKSKDRTQSEEVTETQLHIYALGYQELTGTRPDYVEVYELSERKRLPRSVDDDFIDDVKIRMRNAAEALRSNDLPPIPASNKCRICDYPGMCSAKSAAEADRRPGSRD